MKVEFRHVSGLKVEVTFVDLHRQLIVSKFITDLRFPIPVDLQLNWVLDKFIPKEEKRLGLRGVLSFYLGFVIWFVIFVIFKT